MSTKTVVYVTTTFEGFHCWPDAPDEVDFLRSRHRHLFHVKMGVKVDHNDRDQEFFILKRKLERLIEEVFVDDAMGEYENSSCEDMAQLILSEFVDAVFVEVSEDGENGAIVSREQKAKAAGGAVFPSRQSVGMCFIGYEAEGPLRGSVTLFVPGSVNQSRFLLLCNKYKHLIRSVYYGAGNNNKIDKGTAGVIRKHCTALGLNCTIEAYEDGRVFVTVYQVGNVSGQGFIKEVSEHFIEWKSPLFGTTYVTLVSDPLFESDFYVEGD